LLAAKWNDASLVPLTTQSGGKSMQRAKHPPVRNKINMADPAQARAWTRRLRVQPDQLNIIIEKVGNSVAAVTKQVELERTSRQKAPVSPPDAATPPADTMSVEKLATPV
jgi:predicted nucleic acid-binding Zn ribbon protein